MLFRVSQLLTLSLLFCCFVSVPVSANPEPEIVLGNDAITPPPNYKVAFIGDSGDGETFQSVLDLIVAEGADMVLHQGDFAYDDDSSLWEQRVNNTLGTSFPFLGPDGNHDDWEIYVPFFQARLDAMGISPNPLATGSDNYAVSYAGLRLAFVQQGGNPTFINGALAGDNHIWKICSWHYNQEAMQVGGKDDQQGWGDYEACRQQGAIIATAHEHSYERTRSLTNMPLQTIDMGCPNDPGTTDVDVCVSPERSFVFVSGLAGRSMREQERCLPTVYPYGCQGEWAKVYTLNQTGGAERFGALFITFFVDGDPYKARGYFKNVAGEIVDSFDIYARADMRPNVMVDLVGEDVALSWQALGDHVDHYEVWRSGVPYFAVTDPTAVFQANATATTPGALVTHADMGAGAAANSHYYLVEVVGANSETTLAEVGKFSFVLQPGGTAPIAAVRLSDGGH